MIIGLLPQRVWINGLFFGHLTVSFLLLLVLISSDPRAQGSLRNRNTFIIENLLYVFKLKRKQHSYMIGTVLFSQMEICLGCQEAM